MSFNPETLRTILGLKLRSLRRQRGLGLKELAERTGLSISYLSEIEKGKKYPKPDKLLLLAAALGADFDDLVSTRLEGALDSVGALFESPFLQEFPFELFGITPSDVVHLVSGVPDKVGAMIRTFLEIGRTYDVRVEHFLFAALRSYQQMRHNYFPEIEEAADEFRRRQGWLDRPSVSYEELAGALTAAGDVEVDESLLERHRELQSFRSVWIEGSPARLAINRRLLPAQKAFVVGRELGYRALGIQERAATSSWLKVESFDQVLNNFRASYFAGALLVEREHLRRQLAGLFHASGWDPAAFRSILSAYHATPEILFYRLTELLPEIFGLQDLHFVRFTHVPGSGRFEISKILSLSSIPVPHGSGLQEHHCRRWPGIGLLERIATAGRPEGDVAIAAQRSHFVEYDQSFLVLSMARPLTLAAGSLTSVSLAIRLDARAKRRLRFWGDEAIPSVEVGLTCERCPLSAEACRERVAPPLIFDAEERQKRREEALERVRDEARLLPTVV